MANTCAFRANASKAAAEALYKFIKGDDAVPWESIPGQHEYWKRAFREGHQEYRRIIKEQG